MKRPSLDQQLKVRVDRSTKAALAVEMQRQQRSEGAIVRLALRDYLTRSTPGAAGDEPEERGGEHQRQRVPLHRQGEQEPERGAVSVPTWATWASW